MTVEVGGYGRRAAGVRALLQLVRAPLFPPHKLNPRLDWMAIQEKVWELRFHISLAAVIAGAAISVLSVGPSLATVVGFFWPLLLSTNFCIAAVAVLLRISPPPPPEAACDRAGEEIMDFVAAGQHQAPHEEAAEAEQGHEPSPEGEEHQEERRKEQ